jgi:hypothetical protein
MLCPLLGAHLLLLRCGHSIRTGCFWHDLAGRALFLVAFQKLRRLEGVEAGGACILWLSMAAENVLPFSLLC